MAQYVKNDIKDKIHRLVNETYLKVGSHPMLFALWAFTSSHFRDEGAPFHSTILNAAMKSRKLAIAAPRDHSKSTIVSFLYVCFCVVFKKKRHIIILQNTLAKACGSLGAVKFEVANNLLIRIFNITLERDTLEEVIFKHADGWRVRVLCKGQEQMGSIRGEKFGAYRPDLIIVDDLEDDKGVQNPELRHELERFFNDAVDPAIDYNSGGQILVIGTVLHDDALIAKLISPRQYLEYKKYKYRALNSEGANEFALWPQRYSVDRLKQIEKEEPIKFAKEYQNDPISGARRNFHEKDFRYWSILHNQVTLFSESGGILKSFKPGDCKAAIGCDLAWEEKKENDETVIFPAILTPDDEVLLDYYVNKRGMRPDEFEDIIFKMVDKYERMTEGIVLVGFEKAKLEKVMKWLLAKAMTKRKKYLILKDISWEKDKISRIVTTLSGRYVNHTIFHRKNMGDYEHQLLRIPSGAHDDLPDGAHIVVKLLNFPKKKGKIVEEDSHFEWLRNQHIAKTQRKPHVFGKKRDSFPLKTLESFK
jgi:hypothetical protein